MSLLIYQPQLTVPGDGSGMTEQQIATLSLAAARGGHIFTPLDANYGAVGDGTDEAAKIQECVDEAMASPGNTVVLNPPVTFGIGSVIDFDGTYPVDVIGGTRHFSSSAFTLTKTANTVALRVPATAPRVYFDGISVKGLGGANPDTTPDGKPAMLIHARCRLGNMLLYRCGGLAGLGETDTAGFVVGVLQLAELDNCNTITMDAVACLDCSGDGLYVKNISGSNVNTNVISLFMPRYYGSNGWAVNAVSGMDGTYIVGMYDEGGRNSPGVFQLGGTKGIAENWYAENGASKLVNFLNPGGRANVVSTNDFSKFAEIFTPEEYNNRIVERVRGIRYIGDGTGSMAIKNIGHAVEFSGGVSLPNPAADGYVKVQEAVYADLGTAFSISSSAAQGTVTWTSRFARCAKVGCNVQFYVSLVGAVNVASANAARLTTDSAITGMTYEAGTYLGGPVTRLKLTNSAVTAKDVLLRFVNTTNFQIEDASGAVMSFNDIVGANNFTLEGTILLMDRQGMA